MYFMVQDGRHFEELCWWFDMGRQCLPTFSQGSSIYLDRACSLHCWCRYVCLLLLSLYSELDSPTLILTPITHTHSHTAVHTCHHSQGFSRWTVEQNVLFFWLHVYMCGHKHVHCMTVCREACVFMWISLHNTNYNPMLHFCNINVNQPFNLYTRTPGGGGRETWRVPHLQIMMCFLAITMQPITKVLCRLNIVVHLTLPSGHLFKAFVVYSSLVSA